ncbi:hypothetical protein FRC06_001483, partial [Ceratobasidium sp. 370]
MVSRVTYLIVRRDGHIDIYQSKKNGTAKVPDPYRHLEGKGQEVDDFVQVQSKLTVDYIRGIAGRSHLEDSIRKFSSYTKFSAPTFTRDGRYYWNYDSGLQAQYVLYWSTSEELPDFTNNDDKPGGVVFFDGVQAELGVEILQATEAAPTSLSVVPIGPSHASHFAAATYIDPLTCRGVEFEVPVSLWSNYPWHLHDSTHVESVHVPFHICTIDRDGDVVRVRSHDCTGSVLHPELGCCHACARTLDLRIFKSLMKRAETETPTNGLNRKYYSYKQLLDLLESKDKIIKKYRLKGLELNRNIRRLLGKLNDHRQLVLALAECDEVAVGPFPTLDELFANIKTVCALARATASLFCGYSLLIDEIAAEERMRYCAGEDVLLGLCREHASAFDTQHMTGRPISYLYELKELLDSGVCHRAKEATVVAVAPFSEQGYSPKVILISGTCKTETVKDQRSLICLSIQAWNQSPYGQSALGNLWSIATDGDARRRQAIHSICMSQPLSPTSPIYEELCHLDLLNLMCGEGEITHDGDFKHGEKRLASALRSGDGVFIKHTHLSPMVIKQYLRHLSNITPSHLDSLFDNSDRQDVPKAHALMKAIYDASRLPEICSKPENQPFVLLGEFLNAFYAPHTTPSMSLSQQVADIAKCGFLLFAIFRVDWTHFISSQLYYDIQASVKNAVFCIAKTKVLDLTRRFYLLQLGDDRLEGLFGIYRTLSGDRNLDILQLAERSGAVQQVTDILTQYPESDRKPYRISLEGASGIDHLNPAGWIGNVCVGNVNLQKSWEEGRDAADQALRQAGIVPVFDPNILRAPFWGRDIDLMRPLGNYIGVTELASSTAGLISSASVLVPTLADSELARLDTYSHGDPGPSTLESYHSAFSHTDVPGTTIAPLPPAEDHFTDAELPLEHLLPPCMPAPEDDRVSIPEGSGLKRGWVNVDGRMVHLESATRLILGTESTEKSTDRLRRVCGFSRYPSIDSQSDSILGNFCLIGQLILALVRAGKEVALAVVQVTEIQTGKSKVESISMDHLSRSDITMSGQILALDRQDGTFYWNRSYILASASGRGKQNIPDSLGSTKPMLVSFLACLVEPVNPVLSEHDGDLVWSFQQPELIAATDLLWSKSSENSHRIPVCGSGPGFPYKLGHGGDRLVHHDASYAIGALPAERCGFCYLCGQAVPIKHYMRTHVAKHILASRLGYRDPLLNASVQNMPCGFCGRSGTCKTTLAVTKKSTSLKWSSCPHYDKFPYKPTETTTLTSPCTNRPILCTSPECKDRDPIWSYNMRDHVLAAHGQTTWNHVLNTGLFVVSNEEIMNLKLVDMLVIPGKSPITLRKRPYEGLTLIAGPAPSGGVSEAIGDSVASSSSSKRV